MIVTAAAVLAFTAMAVAGDNAQLSEQEVMTHIREAGFPEESVNTMLCVAQHESARRPRAINVNRNGSTDYGLFQINGSVWGSRCEIDRLFDPAYNARCAKIVFDEQGLTAWVAYNKHKALCDNYFPRGR